MIFKIRRWLLRLSRPPHIVWQFSFKQGIVQVELRQWLPFVLSLLLLIVYPFAPVEELVLVLVALLALVAAAWFWARHVALHFSGTRKLRFGALQVGDEMEENFRLENSGILPVLWARLLDFGKFPDYQVNTVRAVDPHGHADWRQQLICKQRGIFQLGPWELQTGDPFGIFLVRRIYQQSEQMVVYPPLASLRSELLPHGKQQGDLRQLNQPLSAESILATHTRPYQAGDPLRKIHWRTTARRETPYVKIFDPEAASRIWLVPDLDARVHLGSGEDSSEEIMILVLTALAGQLLAEQRAVGLYAAGESPQVVTPQRGAAHLWNLLAALTPLHASQPEPFEKVLHQASHLISVRDLVITVTPAVSGDWMRTLAQITSSQRGSEAWAFLLDPFSFGGANHAEPLLPLLANLGITARVIHKGDVEAQTASYGALRRWEFVTFGTGKLFVRNAPRTAEETIRLAMERQR